MMQTKNREDLAGVLLVDKEPGVTSAQVVARVKKLLGCRRKDRVGHAGTLDPMATGLLVCLVGAATKLSPFFTGGTKGYTGSFLLGRTTTTDDIEGEVLSDHQGDLPDVNAVRELTERFMGTFEQLPPKVSAVRIEGKRAYALARAGEDFVIKPRTVTVHELEFAPGEGPGEILFSVTCGAGFYVRSLARDIGEALGVGGCLTSLRRVSSGVFSVEQAKKVGETSADELLHWEKGSSTLPRLRIPAEALLALRQGNRHRSDPALLSSYLKLGNAEREESVFRFAELEDERTYGLIEKRMDGHWKVKFWDPTMRELIERREGVV